MKLNKLEEDDDINLNPQKRQKLNEFINFQKKNNDI